MGYQNIFLKRFVLHFALLLFFSKANSQIILAVIDSFRIHGDIKITIDKPVVLSKHKKTIITFFALPNGNTTEQTMGKKMKEGDDWHYDIQHILAQTKFIRQQLKDKNFIVVYLENNFKSWPAWKQNHPEFPQLIPHIVDSIYQSMKAKRKIVYLNGHSGGGSFIFGYLKGVDKIPSYIKRISFLDSDYGYDSTYYSKIKSWLFDMNDAYLNVFAYNDSVALYNGKPVVSATGGTWYRSHLMLQHLQNDLSFSRSGDDSVIIYKSNDQRVQFYFKTNPERKIFHTQQVELNGFIHSVLCGTPYDSKGYLYYSKRAYSDLIE